MTRTASTISSPTRNHAAELAGHLLLATALAEKVVAALPPSDRPRAELLISHLEHAVGLAYDMVPGQVRPLG